MNPGNFPAGGATPTADMLTIASSNYTHGYQKSSVEETSARGLETSSGFQTIAKSVRGNEKSERGFKQAQSHIGRVQDDDMQSQAKSARTTRTTRIEREESRFAKLKIMSKNVEKSEE